MSNAECIDFLQWALPRMRLCWKGFRNVRGQVCKRIARRAHDLGLHSVEEYRGYLEAHPAEWNILHDLCRITITRFYRDSGVFRHLDVNVFSRLSALARDEDRHIHIWCAGCAGGEEPYTVAIVWHHGFAGSRDLSLLRVLATDIDEVELARARRAVFPEGVLRELPAELREAAFEHAPEGYVLNPAYRSVVEFQQSDVTKNMPDGPFDVVLCRNLAFTYFDEELQHHVASEIMARMRRGGVLVLGKHETLPPAAAPFTRLSRSEPIYGF